MGDFYRPGREQVALHKSRQNLRREARAGEGNVEEGRKGNKKAGE
jgi:hypothetical protein